MYIKLEFKAETPKAFQLKNDAWIPKSVLDCRGLEHPYYHIQDWWLTIQVENITCNVEELKYVRKKFDEKEKAGISNLLTIHSALSGQTITDLETQFAGKGYGDFKTEVADVVVQALSPIRKRTEELMNDQAELLRILKAGADKANHVANKTLSDVYAALGLIKNG